MKKEYVIFVRSWIWSFLLMLGIGFIIASFSSCNTQKHVVKSESKIDSIASSSSKSESQEQTNAGSKSEDNYESKTITRYTYDTITQQYVINEVITERKGKLIIQDTLVKHVNQTVFDTTHIQIQKESSTSETQKESNTTFGASTLMFAGGALLILIVLYFLYRAFKKAKAAKKIL